MLFLKHLWRLLRETGQFAKQNKAWWIVPLVLMLLLLGLVVVVVIHGAPFLYPLI